MVEYKHIPREQRLKNILIGQSLVTFLIIGVSIWLVFYGFGYKINWHNFSIRHTGIIYLNYSPKDADVYVNDQKKSDSTPFNQWFFPGMYELKIQKEGFVPWTQSFNVEADQVSNFKDIRLFRSDPKVEVLTDKDSISSIDAPYDILVRNPQGNLMSNNYEIWVDNDLITRFSNPISGVVWYPGNEYIGFQQGDEIRIIERNGTNDTLLAKLSSRAETKFLFSWDGSLLLFRDGSSYKKAVIN